MKRRNYLYMFRKLVLPVIAVSVGILLMISGSRVLTDARNKHQLMTARALAEVTESEKMFYDSETPWRLLHYEYSVAEENHKGQGEYFSILNYPKKGDTVEIAFEPNKPKVSTFANPWHDYMNVGVFFGIGALLLLFGLVDLSLRKSKGLK